MGVMGKWDGEAAERMNGLFLLRGRRAPERWQTWGVLNELHEEYPPRERNERYAAQRTSGAV